MKTIIALVLALTVCSANADLIAKLEHPVEPKAIELYSDEYVCVEGAKKAVYRESNHQTLGCWILVEGHVQIAFLNGSLSFIPEVAFNFEQRL